MKSLPIGTIKEIELIYDRGLMLSIVFDDGQEAKTNPFEHRAAVDVGEVRTIAAVAENGRNLIITGRQLRSIHRLRNKKLGDLQRKMSHCKKGSKQW